MYFFALTFFSAESESDFQFNFIEFISQRKPQPIEGSFLQPKLKIPGHQYSGSSFYYTIDHGHSQLQ